MSDYRKKFNELIGDDVLVDGKSLQNNFVDIAQEYKEKLYKDVEEAVEKVVGEYSMYVAIDMYSNLLLEYTNWLSRQSYSAIEQELGKWVAKDLRETIYRENKDEIVKALDQDNLKEIEKLKKWLDEERKYKSGL